jgi:hypothetical protein
MPRSARCLMSRMAMSTTVVNQVACRQCSGQEECRTGKGIWVVVARVKEPMKRRAGRQPKVQMLAISTPQCRHRRGSGSLDTTWARCRCTKQDTPSSCPGWGSAVIWNTDRKRQATDRPGRWNPDAQQPSPSRCYLLIRPRHLLLDRGLTLGSLRGASPNRLSIKHGGIPQHPMQYLALYIPCSIPPA